MGQRKVYIDFVDGNGYIDVSDFVKYDTLSIQESAFNDTYHAAQNTCSFSLIYDASIYTKVVSSTINCPLRIFDIREGAVLHTEADQPILTESGVQLLIETSVAAPVFAGHIPPKSSRDYNGILNNTFVKISATDDLDLFDKEVGDVLYANCAVMNPADPTNSIVHKLAALAGWTASMVSSVSIPTVIPRFSPPDAKATIRSVLDTLLYEYGYTLYLNEANMVSPIQWNTSVPATVPEFNENNIIDEISIEHTINKYDGVKVIYYDMNYANHMRLYRDSNCGYNSDGTFSGYSILNNTDYPPETNAIDETTGNKQIVYQEYTDSAIKYATNKAIQQKLDYNYKNYSSDFTSIVSTENHYVDRRFESGVTVITESFGNKKCQLLYRNTSGAPKLLYYNDVYGTVWYKSAERTAIKNLITTPTEVYTYTTSYTYNKAIGDALALAIAAQYKNGCKKYTISSEDDFTRGTVVRIVLSGEGTNTYALIQNKQWDEGKELYTYTCLSYNPARETLTSQTVSATANINIAESYNSIHTIGTPEAVQEAIDVKNTVFATLALAQASAKIGDLFLDSGLMYRCTVASSAVTLANSTRLTVKNFGKLASAPSSGMVANDTYYNTTNETQYYYDGSNWVAAASSVSTVVNAYAPSYKGIGILAGVSTAAFPGATVSGTGVITVGGTVTPVKGDWMTNYATPVALGMYVWDGANWNLTTDVDYISSAAIDLCNLQVGGITISGFTTFTTAIIKTLFAQQIKLLDNGKLYSGVGNFNNADTPIYLDATGSMSLGTGLTWDGDTLEIDGDITARYLSVSSVSIEGMYYGIPALHGSTQALNSSSTMSRGVYNIGESMVAVTAESPSAPSSDKITTYLWRGKSFIKVGTSFSSYDVIKRNATVVQNNTFYAIADVYSTYPPTAPTLIGSDRLAQYTFNTTSNTWSRTWYSSWSFPSGTVITYDGTYIYAAVPVNSTTIEIRQYIPQVGTPLQVHSISAYRAGIDLAFEYIGNNYFALIYSADSYAAGCGLFYRNPLSYAITRSSYAVFSTAVGSPRICVMSLNNFIVRLTTGIGPFTTQFYYFRIYNGSLIGDAVRSYKAITSDVLGMAVFDDTKLAIVEDSRAQSEDPLNYTLGMYSLGVSLGRPYRAVT